jgi:molybdopterin-binding protein
MCFELLSTIKESYIVYSDLRAILPLKNDHHKRGVIMIQISARNQLKGTIQAVKLGDVMAEIIITLADGQELVSAITRTSAEALKLKQGDSILAIIKSTEVILGRA